jgi:hypothetical protein
MDMSSGGGCKEDFSYLYIEAPEDEAISIFYSRFGHNPNRVSCTCCGQDYSISCDEDLGQLTGYDRRCISASNGKEHKYFENKEDIPEGWKMYEYNYNTCPAQSLKEYLSEDHVKVIYKDEIKSEERHAHVPEQGYVWQ